MAIFLGSYSVKVPTFDTLILLVTVFEEFISIIFIVP